MTPETKIKALFLIPAAIIILWVLAGCSSGTISTKNAQIESLQDSIYRLDSALFHTRLERDYIKAGIYNLDVLECTYGSKPGEIASFIVKSGKSMGYNIESYASNMDRVIDEFERPDLSEGQK